MVRSSRSRFYYISAIQQPQKYYVQLSNDYSPWFFKQLICNHVNVHDTIQVLFFAFHHSLSKLTIYGLFLKTLTVKINLRSLSSFLSLQIYFLINFNWAIQVVAYIMLTVLNAPDVIVFSMWNILKMKMVVH